MKYIIEPEKKVPVVDEADVVVAGGGPGGLPAAIAAARNGAKVVLVERYGFLGGLATSNLVGNLLSLTAWKSSKPINAGILKEFINRTHNIRGSKSWQDCCKDSTFYFEPEIFKLVADEMVRESGLNLWLHSYVRDVSIKNNHIEALIIEGKSGSNAIKGKVFIDATGDGDIGFYSGVLTKAGRDFDNHVQSMGNFFHIGGIPDTWDNDAEREKIKKLIIRGMEKRELPAYNVLLGKSPSCEDYLNVNMIRCPGDPTDVNSLTKAELKGRADVWKIIKYLQKNAPGFENCYLRLTPVQIGPRESRQIIGDYVLAAEDIQQGRKHSDSIARGSWWIDIHCPLGHTYPVHLCVKECPRQNKCSFLAKEHDKTVVSKDDLYCPENDWYDIPYRCLVPKGVDNLLVSGRCISATHQAMAGARVMGTCMAIGEAAGTAAALAARNGINPKDVNVEKLRNTLKANGALL